MVPPAPDQLRLIQEVVGLWFQMQGRLEQNFADIAAEQSLTPMQAKALMELDATSPITMRALAERLHTDPSNLTSVVDRLEDSGAVKRRPHAQDRRAKGVVLTAQGQRMRDTFWRRLVNQVGPLGGLSAAELKSLRTLLSSALAERPA